PAVALGLLLSTQACAPRAAAPPETPTAAQPEAEEPPAETPPSETARLAPDQVAGPPAASCPQPAPVAERRACADFRVHLATALGLDPAARDATLAELESCDEVPDGFVRAVRAELAPLGCADALAAPWLDEHEPRAPYFDTLLALGLAGRLERLARTPPSLPAGRDKAALQEYFQSSLFPWIEAQAGAIQAAAQRGAALRGYDRGVVAVAAGTADMRFVEIARAVPIPTEMAADRELADIYYGGLDEALEPRKARGRDAALVGLLELARVGVHHDRRVDDARALIARVYGGSRMTALDALLVPALPALDAADADARIAAALPSPYTSSLLGAIDWTPALIRAALERGLPVALDRQLQSAPDAASRYLYARAHLSSGLIFFRREDFQTADTELARLAQLAELPADLRADVGLCRALAVALSAGPANSIELIAKGPRFADALGNLSLLDGLALGAGVPAGRAAYDAAFLRELIAEPGNTATWRDLSARYQRASQLLRGPEQKAAKERQAAAQATSRAVTSR
ncbi:MAG TPA: hypothetical protein VLC09_04965, partial [Polyangiaceae bacterium]|nr:hypothetical protein [Polyangiaceae bacterium]